MRTRITQLRVPRHRSTTAHLCSAYPFPVQPGWDENGMYLGSDYLAGGDLFTYEPFAAYGAGLLTNPNMLIVGEPGAGKSAMVKCLIHRASRKLGRWVAIADPKGEYLGLADALGLPIVALRPGGTARLNPLDAGSFDTGEDSEVRQAALLATMLASVLNRDLEPFEDALLGWAVTHLRRWTRTAQPTILDLAAVIADPPLELTLRARMPADELTRAAQPALYALDKLISRSLRGMFDGPTNVALDFSGPGIMIDLSAIHHEPEALRLVMLATTAWLQCVLAAKSGPPRLQVLDEAWSLLGSERTSRYLQSCWKLGRDYGVANVAVVHRLSDLRAQADDGTATSKVAAGLLADTQTRVLFRQSSDQLADARSLLGLTSTEADVLSRLHRGQALWKVGARTAVVQHVISGREWRFCDSDSRMRDR